MLTGLALLAERRQAAGRACTPPREAAEGENMKQRLFRVLYWTGFLLAVAGVLLRLLPRGAGVGLALAVVGVGLLVAARIGAAIRRS